jgi:protein-tyrosine phosphatase
MVILVLCTANACRSVMAQTLLSARLAGRGVAVPVASAGLVGSGRPPPPEVVSVMAARGIDVSGHRSRVVTADDLAAADLILGLTREHVRHAAVLLPTAWPRAFTVRELLRRGEEAGPRALDEPLAHWLTRAADGRRRADLMGSHPADDIADPTGRPLREYQATADTLDRLTRDLVGLGWPNSGTQREWPGSVRNKGF